MLMSAFVKIGTIKNEEAYDGNTRFIKCGEYIWKILTENDSANFKTRFLWQKICNGIIVHTVIETTELHNYQLSVKPT